MPAFEKGRNMKFLKRTILIILALCLAVGMMSCKKKDTGNGEESQTEPVVETFSFLDYSVVRTEKISTVLLEDVVNAYKLLIGLSGQENALSDDFLSEGQTPDAEAKEILIGHTNRPETAEVLAKLSKNEYAVAAVGNKIVIVGAVDSITAVALDYFVDTYLKEGSDGNIEKNLFYKASADVTTLIEAGEPVGYLVCPKGANQKIIDVCLDINEAVNSIAGVSLSFGSATLYEEDKEAVELFVGNVHYETAQSVMSSLKPNQLKISTVGNKIVFGAGTEEMYEMGIKLLSEIMSYSCYTDENGKINMALPKLEVMKMDADIDLVEGAPTMVGTRLYDSVYDAYDGAAMMYWGNATEADLATYTAALEANGFAKYQALDNNSISSATYAKGEDSVHVYLLKRTNELRVVTEKDGILPVNAYDYEKVCDVAVTQYKPFDDPSTYKGMGFLIRLEDGTFVVIDGGETGEYDSKVLYDTMVEQLPEGVDEIVISAWILTHAHSDHFAVLKHFISKYNDKVTVKRLIGNAISDYAYEKGDGEKSWPRDFSYTDVNGMFGGCVNDKAHAGQQYQFPGATFTILFSHEDKYPTRELANLNDASLVFDAVVNGTNSEITSPVKAGSARFIWLGDIGSGASAAISEMYGADLACDVLQIAHHGMGADHRALYTYCAPEIAYWPAGKTVIEHNGGSRLQNELNNKILVDSAKIIFRHEGTHTFIFGGLLNTDSLTGGEDFGSDYSNEY